MDKSQSTDARVLLIIIRESEKGNQTNLIQLIKVLLNGKRKT